MASTAAAKYKAAQEAVAKAKKEAKATAKEALKEMAAEFFAENPHVVSINWNQYTPHFNDGDPCNFSAHVDYPRFVFHTVDGTKLTYCAGAGSYLKDVEEEEYDYDGDYKKYEKETAKVEKSVVKFLKNFDEDDLEEMFGDGVQITITNKGKITTNDYEHD
jgi:hypothetical protein